MNTRSEIRIMAFTSMRFLSFVFLCQNWVTTLNAEKGIEATNQGYGRLGTSMTLKYNTGKEKWSVCYWYRYEAGESADDAENGMFINANGAVTGLATNTFLVLFSGGGHLLVWRANPSIRRAHVLQFWEYR